MTDKRRIVGWIPSFLTDDAFLDELRIHCGAGMYHSPGKRPEAYRKVEVIITVREMGDNYEEGCM